jgi:ABC-2 type transport system permease protein
MKRYWRTIFTLTLYLSKRFMRDKTALFFTFMFPLLFLFVFGALNRGSGDVSFDVAFINNAQSQFAHEFERSVRQNKVFKIKDKVSSISDAKERMGRGEIDSIIELPPPFGEVKNGLPNGEVIVYYEAASPQTGQTLAGIMQTNLDAINKRLTNHTDPLTVKQAPTKTANLSSFDYVFAGLMGFTILSLGIFGMANGFPVEKKTGRLRRLRATPLRASQLILATAIEYLLIGLVSLAMMFAVSLFMFDFNMRGDYLNLLIFTILGILTMFGFGLAIGGWARNEQQSAPLSNLIAFPMMFLSGTFFPRFLMPEWLQNLTGYLPLTPIIDGLRLITTEGRTLLSLGPQLLIIGVWTLVIYFIAIRVFRWE